MIDYSMPALWHQPEPLGSSHHQLPIIIHPFYASLAWLM
jgi:hypothetical protein